MNIYTAEEMKRIIDKATDWTLHRVMTYELVLSSESLTVYQQIYGLETTAALEEILDYLYETQGGIKGIEWKLGYAYARYLFPYGELELDRERCHFDTIIGDYALVYLPYITPTVGARTYLIKNSNFDLDAFISAGELELRKNLLLWTQFLSTAKLSDNAKLMDDTIAYDLTSSGKYRLVFNLSGEGPFATLYTAIDNTIPTQYQRMQCATYKDYILKVIDRIPEIFTYLAHDVTRIHFTPQNKHTVSDCIRNWEKMTETNRKLN